MKRWFMSIDKKRSHILSKNKFNKKYTIFAIFLLITGFVLGAIYPKTLAWIVTPGYAQYVYERDGFNKLTSDMVELKKLHRVWGQLDTSCESKGGLQYDSPNICAVSLMQQRLDDPTMSKEMVDAIIGMIQSTKKFVMVSNPETSSSQGVTILHQNFSSTSFPGSNCVFTATNTSSEISDEKYSVSFKCTHKTNTFFFGYQ